jgi:hypothetical protein
MLNDDNIIEGFGLQHKLTEQQVEEFCELFGETIRPMKDIHAALVFLETELQRRPHYTAKPAASLVEKMDAAFGAHPTLKAQADVLNSEFGGDVDACNKAAAEFGGRIGSLTPGKTPEDKAPTKSTNPWKTNDVDAQVGIIKRLGTRVANDMAKAAGKTLGGAELRRV